MLIDDAGGDDQTFYDHATSEPATRPAISLSIPGPVRFKVTRPPRNRVIPHSVQIDIDSTTRLSFHSIILHLIPFHSSPFVLVHLSFPTIKHLRIPSALSYTRITNRNRNHLHTSTSLWSQHFISTAGPNTQTTTKHLNSPQQIPSCPLARPTSSS